MQSPAGMAREAVARVRKVRVHGNLSLARRANLFQIYDFN
jgi:hypothetical protein